ncbi:MAG: type IV secretory system conjugative DNA transfer family protein, partial [Opitutae bacterium]
MAWAFLRIVALMVIWFASRYFSGQLATGTDFYGFSITVGPVGLLGIVWCLSSLGLVHFSVARLAAFGSIVSGLWGGYLELLRWKPFLNDPAYTTSYILQHLDWLLLISSFLAILVGLAGIFLLSPIYARLRSKRQNRHLHGSARWMKISEARKYLSNGSLIVGECPRSVLQLGAKDPDLLRFDGSGHLLTVAGSGSGKSISVAIPNALSWTGSLVAHDPKGELARLCSRQRRNMGRNVAVIDPADPTSDTINLLETLD